MKAFFLILILLGGVLSSGEIHLVLAENQKPEAPPASETELLNRLRTFSVSFPDRRVQTFDNQENLIREDKSGGSYLELNWDPRYRTGVLRDPQGNTFSYHGLHYSDSPEELLKEYTLLTTDLLASPPRFVAGRFFETTIEGVRSLHLHHHGIDIIFDTKDPKVIANMIVGYEDIQSLMKLGKEAFQSGNYESLKVIEARVQSFFEKVIQQIQEPEPPFPPETISVDQIQAFQKLIQQTLKAWIEAAETSINQCSSRQRPFNKLRKKSFNLQSR